MPARLVLAATLAAPLWAAPAAAAPVDDLIDALEIDRVVQIMRDEGLDYADQLARDMLPAGPDPEWRAVADRIYDAGRMEASVRAGFVEALGDTDLEPLVDFFESDLGARIIELELATREAMIDPAVEEAAREDYREMQGEDTPLLASVEAFIEANDLVEQNVTGALNASLAFYRGLEEGGAMDLGEEDILADVWSQEEATRADTTEWLFGYLLTAYEPLGEAELERYVELSESEAGAVLNRALFAGFNGMYNEISYAMGLAAARQMAETEL